MLDTKQQKIYDNYFDLFSSKGWKLYIQTVKEDKDLVIQKGVYESKTELELGRSQGALHYLDTILGLETRIEQMHNEAGREEGEQEGDSD